MTKLLVRIASIGLATTALTANAARANDLPQIANTATAVELSGEAEVTLNATTGAYTTHIVRRLFGPDLSIAFPNLGNPVATVETPTTTGFGMVSASLADLGTSTNNFSGTTLTYDVHKGVVTASNDPRFKTGLAVMEVHSFANSFGLNYTEFGFWTIKQRPKAAAPALAGVFGGIQPGAAAFKTTIPTTGGAEYLGGAIGIMTANGKAGQWGGRLQLTALFSGSGGMISGSITHIVVLDVKNDAVLGSINDLRLGSASFAKRSFSGSVSAGATAGTFANLAGGTGVWAGQFYGPSAAEVAGILRFSTGTINVLGGFAGKH